MNILFVHQNFPGQYLHIARALASQGGHQLVSLSIEKPEHIIPGVTQVRYGLSRGNQPGVHPWLVDLETKLLRGESCAKAAHQLKQQGLTPSLICGHPGWGELLFLKDIWPEAPILAYQEFFYQVHGFDFDFDAELQGEPSWESAAKIRMKSVNQILNLEASTWCISPTQFQRSSFPAKWQSKISVIHDGINTHIAKPSIDAASLTLPDGTELKPGDPIVTFVNRRLEPYRGCHTMIRAIPALQALQPDAHLVLIGRTEGVAYGARCPDGEWKDHFLAEIEGQYDPSRVHFTETIPHSTFIRLLQISAAHVYLTYPFVLSWSLLEAMACGCAIVGSATAPVMEVIQHEITGLLVDFFQPQQLAEAVSTLISDRALGRQLGQRARQVVENNYSLEKCLPRQLGLMSLVAHGAIGIS